MTKPTGSHPCPRCGTPIRRVYVACHPCWFKVPIELRQAVTAEYGRQPGSIAHVRAYAAARQWCKDNALS
jgi:hypothetical protein